MSIDTQLLQRILEGALLASGKPLSVQQLSNLFEEGERPENDQIRATLEDISNEYQGRGFELKQVASGYRFQVIQETAPVEEVVEEEQAGDDSEQNLAMETADEDVTAEEI